MGKPKGKRKVTIADYPPIEDGKTTISDTDDDDDRAVLAKQATSSAINSPEPTLANILAAIGTLKDDITIRFNGVDATLHSVQASLSDHKTRITDLEGAVTDHDTRLADLERYCEELKVSNTAMKRKLIDLESRSRRSNIKITGIPEKAENGNPTRFIADLLPKLLGTDSFPNGLKVDRAHRLGAQPSPARPRVMITEIHHLPEEKKILNLARLQSPLSFNGARISIFPDFPPEITEQRRSFDGVKKKLREAGIQHGLLFPARLILTFGFEQKVFLKPYDAETFIDEFITPAAAPQHPRADATVMSSSQRSPDARRGTGKLSSSDSHPE